MPRNVIMPALGMAQDTGLLVAWCKKAGDPVAVGDVLFEVETDKATMEVEADTSGFLAATLAEAGEVIPTGETIAIISEEKPETTLARRFSQSLEEATAPVDQPEPLSAKPKPAPELPKIAEQSEKKPAIIHEGRVLASPKARRLALERGIDLNDMRAKGVAEPIHAAEVESFAVVPNSGETMINISVNATRFYEFITSVQSQGEGISLDKILALVAAKAYVGKQAIIAVSSGDESHFFQQVSHGLSGIRAIESHTRPMLEIIKNAAAEPTGAPALTLMTRGQMIDIFLHYQPQHMTHHNAQQLITSFAGQLEEPLRQLL